MGSSCYWLEGLQSHWLEQMELAMWLVETLVWTCVLIGSPPWHFLAHSRMPLNLSPSFWFHLLHSCSSFSFSIKGRFAELTHVSVSLLLKPCIRWVAFSYMIWFKFFSHNVCCSIQTLCTVCLHITTAQNASTSPHAGLLQLERYRLSRHQSLCCVDSHVSFLIYWPQTLSN